MKRKIALVCAAAMALSLAACGSTTSSSESTAASDSTASESTAASDSTASESTAASESTTEEAPAEEAAAGDFDATQAITVISREDGSGTRGAFIELTGVEDDNGDNTTQAAAIQNSTNGVMTTVANDATAIGYISLGSLDEKEVKAVTVAGVAPSAATVTDGTYTLARPFNIVTNGEQTDALAVDFINYCMSAEGQAIATEEGCVGSADAAAFEGTLPEGSIVVGGSTSVSPLMEKLIEGYQALNANATIELQTTDSTTGVTGVMDGSYTIGMASRELKEEETAQGAVGTVLAMDGIAVIVNPANTAVEDLSIDQIRSIYVGETTTWDAL